MTDILFLGDSITDCDHCFSSDNLGYGYVRMLAQRPGVTAVNGGTDGFTFPRVLQKWRRMFSGRRYDHAVVTCGINEVGVIVNTGIRPWEAERYLDTSMESLRLLLAGLLQCTGPEAQQSEPGAASVLLLEPFLFPEPKARIPWFPLLETVRQDIQAVVSDFAPRAQYLPVQDALDELAGDRGYGAVTTDGIHLTEFGHERLAALVAEALHI